MFIGIKFVKNNRYSVCEKIITNTRGFSILCRNNRAGNVLYKPEFDTWRVILGVFGVIGLRNQALRKVVRNCLYWQT